MYGLVVSGYSTYYISYRIKRRIINGNVVSVYLIITSNFTCDNAHINY